MGESNISLPRILTVAEGTNPITVGQCGIQGTTLGRVDLDFSQRQAKQTRSYLQVWYLIYHKVEVVSPSKPYQPGCCCLLPFDIRISIVIVDLNLGTKRTSRGHFPLSARATSRLLSLSTSLPQLVATFLSIRPWHSHL
jgi:hypothetical protein